MKEWDEEYGKIISDMFGGLDNYLKVKLKLRRPMINQIIEHAGKEKPIIECGIGTGKMSSFLALLGYRAFGIDIDDNMLKIAKKTSDKMCLENPVQLLNADIKDIPFNDKYFSVAHSSGVLEHFSDQEITGILREEMRVADTVVLAVPSPYFCEDEKMRGDERFLPKGKWRELIFESRASIIADKEFHLLPFLKRLARYTKRPEKIFAPKAMHLFTINARG